MHNLAQESHLFEHQQRHQFANLERQHMINEALVKLHPPILSRISKFAHTLNRVRRIRIEVTFNYQEPHLETT